LGKIKTLQPQNHSISYGYAYMPRLYSIFKDQGLLLRPKPDEGYSGLTQRTS